MEKLKPKIDIYAGRGVEKEMEGQRLCRECQEWVKAENFWYAPYQHCHHPEPEPEKSFCEWCNEWTDLWRSYLGTQLWKTLRRMVTKCPECGAPL